MSDLTHDQDARYEDDGLPALGDDTEDEALPGERESQPASFDWGVTPHEESGHEPLGARLAREEPDIATALDDSEVGRLVAPDERGSEEETAVAIDDVGGLTAEESAVHVIGSDGHGLTG